MIDVESTVLRLYDQFTTLEDRESVSLAPELLRMAKERVGAEIISLLSDAEVSRSFLDKTEAAVSFKDDMTLLVSTNVLDETELEDARRNTPRDAKMGFVALRFLEQKPAEESAGVSGKDQQVSHELPMLFRGDVQHVAAQLVGKHIQHGNSSVLVAATLPQTQDDNRRWLASRPLFGESPVNVFIANYRGNPMLFLRAEETDSCVRISSGIDPDSGEQFVNPKQVCDALGLEPDTVGDMSVRDNVVTVQVTGKFERPTAK